MLSTNYSFLIILSNINKFYTVIWIQVFQYYANNSKTDLIDP